MKVDDFIEEEGSACCPRKPRGDQFVPVGEEGVALRACEETTSADVFQVNAAHICSERGGERRNEWDCGNRNVFSPIVQCCTGGIEIICVKLLIWDVVQAFYMTPNDKYRLGTKERH